MFVINFIVSDKSDTRKYSINSPIVVPQKVLFYLEGQELLV